MTWLYRQTTGDLFHNGELVARGYSGFGIGRNNPTLEGAAGVGPCPAGLYRVTGAPYDSEHTGPYTLALEPVGHDALGRTALRVHGDNASGNASRGCLIFPRAVRVRIFQSNDRELLVTA